MDPRLLDMLDNVTEMVSEKPDWLDYACRVAIAGAVLAFVIAWAVQ